MFTIFISLYGFYSTLQYFYASKPVISNENPNFKIDNFISSGYPTSIPDFQVRTFNGKPVERGVLELLGGVSTFTKDQENGKWDEFSKKVPLKGTHI